MVSFSNWGPIKTWETGTRISLDDVDSLTIDTANPFNIVWICYNLSNGISGGHHEGVLDLHQSRTVSTGDDCKRVPRLWNCLFTNSWMCYMLCGYTYLNHQSWVKGRTIQQDCSLDIHGVKSAFSHLCRTLLLLSWAQLSIRHRLILPWCASADYNSNIGWLVGNSLLTRRNPCFAVSIFYGVFGEGLKPTLKLDYFVSDVLTWPMVAWMVLVRSEEFEMLERPTSSVGSLEFGLIWCRWLFLFASW
jgi:hypothetical protein